MKKTISNIVAFIACAIELVLYGVVCGLLGLKKGGGYLFLILLFSLMSITWKSIISAFNKKNKPCRKDIENKNNLCQLSENPQDQSICDTDKPFVSEDISITNNLDNSCLSADSRNSEISETTNQENIIDKSSTNNHNDENSVKEDYTTSDAAIADDSDDFNKIIKILLILMMGSSCLNLFSQLLTNLTWQNYSIAAYQFIGGLINLFAFILIYKKNIWGFIIFVFMMILQIPLNLMLGADDIDKILLSAFVRIIVIGLLLTIRHNGISGWSLLIRNADFTIVKTVINTAINIKLPQKSLDENTKIKTDFDNCSALNTDGEKPIQEETTDKLDKTITESTNENENKESVDFVSTENNSILDSTDPICLNGKKSSPKKIILLSSAFVVLLLVLAGGSYFYNSITSHEYPKYVDGLVDKIYYHYDWANNKLNSSLIEQAKNASDHDLDELCKEYMEAASDIKTTDINSINKLIDFFEDKDIYEKVKSLSEWAISLYPEESRFYASCAEANLELGNKSEVVRLAQKALEIDTQSVIASYILARYYYKVKDYENCLKWAKKWSTLDPEAPVAYYVLAKFPLPKGKQKCVITVRRRLSPPSWNDTFTVRICLFAKKRLVLKHQASKPVSQ